MSPMDHWQLCFPEKFAEFVCSAFVDLDQKLDENSVGDVVAWCGVDDIGKLGYEL